MILVYALCTIISFFTFSAIFKRKRRDPDSRLYKEDPEEVIPGIIFCSLLWPVAIAGGALIWIVIRLYKRWERWINK
jgi:hypothetical protein